MKILITGDYYTELLELRLLTYPNIILKKCTKNLEKLIELLEPDFIFICEENCTKNIKNADHHTTIITNKKTERENCLTCFVNPIDETKTSKCTIMENAIDVIIEYVFDKKIGNYDFINPGVMSSDTQLRLNLNLEKNILKYKCVPELVNSNVYYEKDYRKKINIYMPTYYRFEKTKRSIESIHELINRSNYDVKLYIGDNNTKIPEMREWLKQYDTRLSNTNLGKADMVNLLHKNARKCDYIFSIDSDMYSNEEINSLDFMIDILDTEFNIGVVSSNQYELPQHWFDTHIKVIEGRKYKLGDSKTNVGVAGGCICMRTVDFEKIGMYKEKHDIYTGDDGILMINVKKKLGKKSVVSMDYGLVHPKSLDEEEDKYQNWKMESWKRDNLKFLDENFKGKNKTGFYD